MEDQMECMCLACGVSIYLDSNRISKLEEIDDMKVVGNSFCPSCGGALALVGKAGDQPFYRLK